MHVPMGYLVSSEYGVVWTERNPKRKAEPQFCILQDDAMGATDLETIKRWAWEALDEDRELDLSDCFTSAVMNKHGEAAFLPVTFRIDPDARRLDVIFYRGTDKVIDTYRIED